MGSQAALCCYGYLQKRGTLFLFVRVYLNLSGFVVIYKLGVKSNKWINNYNRAYLWLDCLFFYLWLDYRLLERHTVFRWTSSVKMRYKLVIWGYWIVWKASWNVQNSTNSDSKINTFIIITVAYLCFLFRREVAERRNVTMTNVTLTDDLFTSVYYKYTV